MASLLFDRIQSLYRHRFNHAGGEICSSLSSLSCSNRLLGDFRSPCLSQLGFLGPPPRVSIRIAPAQKACVYLCRHSINPLLHLRRRSGVPSAKLSVARTRTSRSAI